MYLRSYCIFTCMFAAGILRILPPSRQQFYRLCINQRISWHDEQYSHLLIFCWSWIRQATKKNNGGARGGLWRDFLEMYEYLDRVEWSGEHELTVVTRIEASKMRLECLWERCCCYFRHFFYIFSRFVVVVSLLLQLVFGICCGFSFLFHFFFLLFFYSLCGELKEPFCQMLSLLLAWLRIFMKSSMWKRHIYYFLLSHTMCAEVLLRAWMHMQTVFESLTR